MPEAPCVHRFLHKYVALISTIETFVRYSPFSVLYFSTIKMNLTATQFRKLQRAVAGCRVQQVVLCTATFVSVYLMQSHFCVCLLKKCCRAAGCIHELQEMNVDADLSHGGLRHIKSEKEGWRLFIIFFLLPGLLRVWNMCQSGGYKVTFSWTYLCSM